MGDLIRIPVTDTNINKVPQGYEVKTDANGKYIEVEQAQVAELQSLLNGTANTNPTQAAPAPGTALQRTQKGPKDPTVVTEKTYTKADIDKLKLDPRVFEALKASGVLIEAGENFKLVEGKNLQEAINNEYKKLPELITIPDELAAKLPAGKATKVENPAGTPEGTSTYEVKPEDKDEVLAALEFLKKGDDGQFVQNDGVTVEQGQDEKHEPESATLTGTTTTTTTVHNEEIPIKTDPVTNQPVQLRDDKQARKDLQKAYEAELNKWVADPENQDTFDYSLVNMKYGKKVDKQKKELAKLSNFELYDQYYDVCAPQSKALIDKAAKDYLSDEKNQQAILLMHNQLYQDRAVSDFKDINPNLLERIARNCIYNNELKLQRDDLINVIASKRVLDDVKKDWAKDPNKAAEDKKWFVEHMAEREVNTRVTKQNQAQTETYYSKAERKAGEKGDPNKIHKDIGKWGRKLVEKSMEVDPELFCTEVTGQIQAASDKELNEQGIFRANGKLYKFDGAKWQAFFDADSDSRFDEGEFEGALGHDHHTTLDEARHNWLKKRVAPNGKTYSLDQLIGNGDGKVGNRELNRYLNEAKSASVATDKNKTGWLRFLHVGKDAVLGAGAAAATAFGGWALATGASIGGVLAGELIHVPGQEYSGTVKTTDYVTENGFTDSYTHETPYSGRTADRDIQTSDREFSGTGRQSGLEIAGKAAPFGAALGALKGLFSMKNVNDKGTRWDHIVDLESDKTTTDVVAADDQITIPPRHVQTYSRTVEEQKEVDKYPVVRYRGPEAYSVMYQDENGNPVSAREFAKAYQEKTGTIMTNYNFFAFPELTINGKTFRLRDDAAEQYKTIKEGRPGGRAGKTINTPTITSRHTSSATRRYH